MSIPADNPVWILPSHAPNTSPPYRYYPDTVSGPISLTLFVFFKTAPASAVPITLTSDEPVFTELQGGPWTISMTQQAQSFSLTTDQGIDPNADGSPASFPVMLSVEQPNGQKSKVIVDLHSHPST